jgi:SAM-dependent methyltransferase
MSDGHAAMWRHMIGLLPETDLSGKDVLDFGCNQGGFLRLLHALRPFRHGLGIDIAEASVAKAEILSTHMPIRFRVGSTLGGLEGQFDIAFSHEVIYLVPDIATHAREMFAALRPGGIYYAVTGCHTGNPLWPRWRELVAERTNTIVQDRSVTDYAEAFATAGFTVSARRLGFDGFVPFKPGGWMPTLEDALDYALHTKVLFRLIR